MLLTARTDSPYRGAQNLPADTERVVTALAYLAPLLDLVLQCTLVVVVAEAARCYFT
jgi:hypothetical protein